MDALISTSPDQAVAALQEQGWAFIQPDDLLPWLHADAQAAEAVHESWSNLPADPHLRDGGAYRFRRHSCFTLDTAQGTLTQTPHRAHWQPVTYNALHGGFERWFKPVDPAICAHPLWQALLRQIGMLVNQVKPVPTWFIEAHQFRVDTAGGIGRPTPEGAHRDGVDFVAVLMLGRHHIKGGETRIFDADSPRGVRSTLEAPWSAVLLDDERVIHETSPIQPLDGHGWRDTLVLTYRQGGFQSDTAE